MSTSSSLPVPAPSPTEIPPIQADIDSQELAFKQELVTLLQKYAGKCRIQVVHTELHYHAANFLGDLIEVSNAKQTGTP